ncbi:MAG: putative inorganic carbon transporter subunit DabA, partial [Halobacteria archaeon]|nr:putative inorganic carbon transporter subunit DabA [Halobacteria archaeon]
MPDKRETKVEDSIEAASEKIGKVWPLHSFVTSNPLAGFEDGDFHEAVGHGEGTFGGAGYPDSSTFRRAWEEGRVDPEILRGELRNHGFEAEPVETLERMEEEETTQPKSLSAASDERVDRVLTKWLAAFCDQGRAEAPMPFRDEGFYGSWRSLVSHDGQIPVDAEEMPESAEEAVKSVLSDVPEERWQEVFEYHLAALPGWTGFIKQRSEDGGEWQQEHPIDLTDYVAVRLSIADAVGADVVPKSYESDSEEDSEKSLRGVWLEAWERSYRQGLVESVSEKAENHAEASVDDSERPEAQLVFCIDTRSEVIRRHIED